MIVQLTGLLLATDDSMVTIDVNGVGYQVEVPENCLLQLPSPGESLTVYTHFVVREDAQQLYGFTDTTQRALFRALIKTSGVGPKLALTILSQMSPDDFVHCVRSEDLTTIRKIKGVGQKVAERLVLEMRTRLADWQVTQLSERASAGGSSSLASASLQDALAALQKLGFKANHIEQILTELPDAAQRSSQELIRLALQKLA